MLGSNEAESFSEYTAFNTAPDGGHAIDVSSEDAICAYVFQKRSEGDRTTQDYGVWKIGDSERNSVQREGCRVNGC